MRPVLYRGMAAIAFVMAAFSVCPSICAAQSFWTEKAVIEAPRVMQTAISRSGETAFYISRQDHLATNSRDSTLFKVDLARRTQRLVLRSRWISQLQQIPGSNDWSLLADLGKGVELYRLTRAGVVIPIVQSRTKIVIGADPDLAVTISADEADEAFGVLGYGWAPDGKSLWYSTAREVAAVFKGYRVLENPTVPLDIYRPNVSELHVVDVRGRDHLIASARGNTEPYPSIVYRDRAATWDDLPGPGGAFGISFIDMPPGSGDTPLVRRVHLSPPWGRAQPTVATGLEATATPGNGPGGGRISLEGGWGDERLVEAETDGKFVDFGRTDVDKSTAMTIWPFLSEHRTVLAVRHVLHNDRHGLIRLGANGESLELDKDASIDDCSFSVAAAVGICIRNGLAISPTLILVDVRNWTATTVLAISPTHAAIAPLTVVPRHWGNPGSEASGFVVYPRNYDPTVRYPSILLVHGSDAENRFVDSDYQWSYPAQLWSERGYVVVYVNDIYSGQSTERLEADEQWQGGETSLSRERLRQLLWLDEVTLYDQIIRSLDQEGLIDPARVGIAGYSRGSQKVNVAVTQSNLFAAASSGDGSYFAPSQYWLSGIHGTDEILFGGSPYDPVSSGAWQSLSPVLRAGHASAAVLFQVARVLNSRVDFYQALRAEGVPAEFEFFDQETHLLNRPSDRLIAMTENLDWFDYWLRDVRDEAPEKAPQYERWDAMKVQASKRVR